VHLVGFYYKNFIVTYLNTHFRTYISRTSDKDCCIILKYFREKANTLWKIPAFKMWHVVTRYTGTVTPEKSGTSIFTLNMEIVRSSVSWLVHQATRHHVSEHRQLSSSSRREKFKSQAYSFYKELQDTSVCICIRVVPVWILSGLPATVVEGFRTFIRPVSAGKGGRSTLIIQSRYSSSVILV